jgi:hypothetical protein
MVVVALVGLAEAVRGQVQTPALVLQEQSIQAAVLVAEEARVSVLQGALE